jgi:hypothetical protein
LGTDVPRFRALANRPYGTPESLQAYIMTPRHPRPAIPLELNEKLNEIRDVVDYIQSPPSALTKVNGAVWRMYR